MKKVFFYQMEIGEVGIATDGRAITNLYFGEAVRPREIEEQETALLKNAAQQIREYLAGERQAFDLRVSPEGTPFQQAVWQVLQMIPYGETWSYKQVAERLGRPKAARAVGLANHNNPIAIVIPCHRVIGSDGRLSGYAGGLTVKAHLLALEKEHLPKTIAEQLLELAEPAYQRFAAALLPGVENVLGVRFPVLRRIARRIAKGNWRQYLEMIEQQRYFEESVLQAMVIGYIKADIEEILPFIKKFIPKIDNWSVCDTFCQGLKLTDQHQERMWAFLQPYLASDRQYEIRFGVVMVLRFFVRSDYSGRAFAWFDQINHEGYYVKMAVAWAVSVFYQKMPAETVLYLHDNQLDDFTYAKSLQKITESLRSDQQTKELMRRLREYRQQSS